MPTHTICIYANPCILILLSTYTRIHIYRGKQVQPAKVGVIVRKVDGAATPFATTSAADRAGSVCLISHPQPGDQVVSVKGNGTSYNHD